MNIPLASLGRSGRRESKSSISVSISSASSDDGSSTDSTNSFVKPQKLQPRRSSSLKKAMKNMAIASNETNKTLKNSNSAHRLMNKFTSLTKKMDYQKIEISNRCWISDATSKDSQSSKTNPKSKSNTKSTTPPRHRPGVRRARSCDDDFTSLYKAAQGGVVIEERDTSHHSHNIGSRRHSELIGNPQSADDDTTDSRNHSFLPNAISTPNFLSARSRRNPPASTSSGSSKTSSNASYDLLTRAAAIAGRKQRRLPHPSNIPTPSTSRAAELEERLNSAITSAPSTEMYIERRAVLGERLSATRPAFSSSYNNLPGTGALGEKPRRRSDPLLDFSEFPDPVPQPDPIIRATSVPVLSAEEKEKRRRRSGSSSDRTTSDGSSGNNRRRSKRTSDPDKQRPQPPDDGEELRRNMFRKDFPDEPIPSDVILVRLYGTKQIPPPPPYATSAEEQLTPPQTRNSSIKSFVKPLSPDDLQKSDDATSYTTFETEVEWKAWKASVDKSRRRNKSKYPTKHPTAEALIKGKYSRDESRRSESSKSKNSSSSNRRSSTGKTPGVLSHHREIRSDSDRARSRSNTGNRHRVRHSSKTKGDASNSCREIRNSIVTSSTIHDNSAEAKHPKSKGNKRRDGLSHSSHDTTYSPSEESSRSKARKRGETIKVKSKTATPPPAASNGIVDHDIFEMAMLDLSNGSFFDNEDVSEHCTRASLALLRSSLTRVNSVKSCDDIADLSGDCGGKPDRERKKKRRGKRSGSVGSEGHTRSKSADGRSGAKTRRGKRSSNRSSPKAEDHKPYSISGSQRSLNSDNRGSQRKSPKFTSRKNSINEGGAKQRRSPKFTSRKQSTNDGRSPKSPTKPTRRGGSLKSYPIVPRSQLGASQVSEKEESQNGDDDFYDLALASWVDGPTDTPKTTKPSLSRNDCWTNGPTDTPKTMKPSLSRNECWTNGPTDTPKTMKPSLSRNECWTNGPTETPRTAKSSFDVPIETPRIVNSAVSKIDLPRRRDHSGKTSRWQSEPSSMWSPYTVKSISDTAAAMVPEFADFDTSTPRSRSNVEMRPTASKAVKAINFPLNFVEHVDVSPLTVASKKVTNNPFLPIISYLDN